MNNLSGASQRPNTVKYKLYLSSEVDDQLLESYHKFLEKLTDNNESPTAAPLQLKRHPRRPNYLYGKTSVDGRVEDEWLIVYSLFKLSEHDPDLVIKVFDNDGDILLIEAAEHLPRWLESRESKNRTFIHSGRVHIIPRDVDLKKLKLESQSCSAAGHELPLAQVAANYVRDTNNNNNNKCDSTKSATLASSSIQQAIRKQLACMPDKGAWLERMYRQLDDIISDRECQKLKNKLSEPLTLSSVMKMSDDELATSPISSPARSSRSSAISSSPPLSPAAAAASSRSSSRAGSPPRSTEQQND